MQLNNDDNKLGVTELAGELGVHVQTLYRWLREFEKNGKGIRSERDYRNRYRIHEEWVEDWAESLFDKKTKKIEKNGRKTNE